MRDEFRDALNERGVGQTGGESHEWDADAIQSAGEAGNATIDGVKTRRNPSRSNHPRTARGGGQKWIETHKHNAAPTVPAYAGGVGHSDDVTHQLHADANSFDGQYGGDRHLSYAVEPATTGEAKPDCESSRAPITDPGNAGETSAIYGSKPIESARSSQPSGRKSGRGAIYAAKPKGATPHALIPDAGQSERGSQEVPAGAGAEIDGQWPIENHEPRAVDLRFSDPLIAEIVEIGRLRTDMMRAMQRLDLQAQAMLRRYIAKDYDYSDEKGRAKAKAEAAKAYAKLKDGEVGDLPNEIVATIMVFRSAIEPIEAQRTAYEKHLRKLARELPVYEWAKSIWGLGELGLAKIVAQAGDLSVYKSAGAVWKRMGLAVIDGERQRRIGGADALVHAYSPQRRSEMWNIGGGIIGGMGLGVRPLDGEDISLRDDWSPYQKLFVQRCRYEVARDPEAHARPVTKTGKESYSKHAANRAKRYVEKRLLRDLRAAWRRSAMEAAETS